MKPEPRLSGKLPPSFSEPLQIGRSFREWWFLALVGSVPCLLTAGVALLVVKSPFGAGLLIGGGIAALSAGLAAFFIRKSRFQVQIGTGVFRVCDRHGEREFIDDQVICASLSTRPNYVNGVLKSMTRTFDVWVEGDAGPERVKMVNRLAVGAFDPLANFVERLFAHLHERATFGLENGQPFEGEGWTLYPVELVVQTGRASQYVQLEDLAAAEIFDDHICVWKHGQDEPVMRIPTSAANTQILTRLLQERIARRPQNGEPPAGNRLGRVLFERKPGRLNVALLWLLPIAALLTIVIVKLGVVRGGRGAFLVSLPLVALFGLIWLLVLSQSVEFRVHEHGVRRKWLFRSRQLKFSEVDSFTYSAVRHYAKGVYTGTNFTLTFAALAGGKPKKLTYAKNLRNADADLDRLRDYVSRLIADRMAAQFALDRPVTWTEGLRFLPEGLEYRPSGFLGRKAPIVIPYEQIYGFDANQGTFWLWVDGRKKPRIKESISLPNFFPGYLFLTELLASRPPRTRATEESTAAAR